MSGEGRLDAYGDPIVRRKTITAVNGGDMMAILDFGEYGTIVTDEPSAHGGSGEGPSPLQTVVGALCGCETVTFNRTAADMDFDYAGIRFEAAFTVDIRGRMGNRLVRPHFQTVSVRAVVRTDESDDRLADVIQETEARCPVFNLLRDADVKLDVEWAREPVVADL